MAEPLRPLRGHRRSAVLAIASELVAEAAAEDIVEKAVGPAGIVMAIISIALGAADIAISIGEVVSSPFSYTNDIVLTKDVSVQLRPDTGDTNFPMAANRAIVRHLRRRHPPRSC